MKLRKRIVNAWAVLRGKKGVMTISAQLIKADGTVEDIGDLAIGSIEMNPKSE